MTSDDETPHRLMGRAGLVFAYVCFGLALATIGAAIYLLPLVFKVKLFLILALIVLASLFVFMAILAHVAARVPLKTRPCTKAPIDRDR